MQLQRLTGLEIEKIENEYKEVMQLIDKLKAILASKQLVLNIIKEDLEIIIKEYGDARRTEIIESESDFDIEDLIDDEEMVITISNRGYIKRTSTLEYRAQRRGGRGMFAMETNDDDFVSKMFVATNHNFLLFFSTKGKVYWLKVYRLPEGARRGKGKALVNLLELEENENITAVIPIKEFTENAYLIMLTKFGLVKKTALMAYCHPRKKGTIGITLNENDTLINVQLTDGNSQIVVGTKNGQAIRFEESRVRSCGRTAMGVRGISLDEKNNDEIIGMIVINEKMNILTVTENGYGKRTEVEEYRLTNRGGKGIINIKTSERNGKVVSMLSVEDKDELMIITRNGIIIRQKVADLRAIGRNTQGVRLIKLGEGDYVIAIAKAEENLEEETLAVSTEGTNSVPIVSENSENNVVPVTDNAADTNSAETETENKA